jgi:hypothetical protein
MTIRVPAPFADGGGFPDFLPSTREYQGKTISTFDGIDVGCDAAAHTKHRARFTAYCVYARPSSLNK